MLLDDYMPTYEISDSVATVAEADARATWDALMEVDLVEVGRSRPLIGLLPGVLVGARHAHGSHWALGVGSGAHVLVNGVIEEARDRAEGAAPRRAG